MQLSHISIDQLADMIEAGKVLCRLEYGAHTAFVLHWGGSDLIAVQSPSDGSAIVVSPCSQDAEVGGSVHDQARQIWQ